MDRGLNVLTEEEKADGFELLFNGKDLAGWHRVQEGYGTWAVDDDAICHMAPGGGMLYADEQFGDFALKAEFKLDEKVNSGVFFRVGNERDEVQTGFEMQVLDDLGRPVDKHSNGALYDCVAPAKLMTKPTGEWHTVVITCEGSKITIAMNGEQIVDADTDQWTEPNKNPDGTPNKFRTAIKDFPRVGSIGLQDHGGRLWYRNLKIKRL